MCRTGCLAVTVVSCLLVWAPPVAAQEEPVPAVEPQEGAAQGGKAGEAEEAEEAEEEEPSFEAEIAGSTVFQAAAVGARLWSGVWLDAHFFGVEDSEFGLAGLGWEFRWRRLRVIPGLAWAVSSDTGPKLVLTARWHYESERWTTQGLWVQSLQEAFPTAREVGEEHSEHEETLIRHGSILDGVHLSARFGRLEAGPIVEHIRYREENAWKGGGRVAWRAGRGLALVSHVMGPDTELRVGLVWER